jgi:signal transduction histidine kinase
MLTQNKINQSTDQLRERLLNILKKKVVDFNEVLFLSTELAKQDPDFVRFSVDAGIIDKLGRELVARQETAVAELIKNAYDAEAEKVDLIFYNTEKSGGDLEVDDDGLGMTREQLIDGFMRISSAEKVDEPLSPNYNRRRAGRKGIGRFAVQRLGEKLKITTQTLNSQVALQVEIDWNKFKTGVDLSRIVSRIKEVPKRKEHGTTLIIEKLREAWNEASIRQVYQYISELIQPFPLAKKNRKKGDDPGFKAALFRAVNNDLILIADEQTQIFEYALAEIEGKVDRARRGFWSIRSNRYSIDEHELPIGTDRENPRIAYKELRSINFKAYYFIYNAGLLPRSLNNTIQEIARTKGGVRVYRNGFRVRPYGGQDDDWLGLDESTRFRTLLPPHANNNFFGFVEIIDPEGKLFDETSSRERLLENKAFEELQDFVSRTLKAAVVRIAEARGKKISSSQKDWKKDVDPSERVRDAATKLSKAIAAARAAGKEKKGTTEIEEYNELMEMAEEAVVEMRGSARIQEELLEERDMLRVLASLGLIIGEFTHEIKQTLGAAYIDSKNLALILKKGTRELRAAEDLKFNVERFKAYASYFDKIVAANVVRELSPQRVTLVIRRFVETIKSAALAAGIQIEQPKYTGTDIITRPMHFSEWASILFNLYSNARKAIDRAGVKGKIIIRAGREDGNTYFEFADNGDGIPPESQERIFNAFFTTSRPAGRGASEEEEAQGSGLGLKIVKDIVSGYDGKIYLVPPPAKYSTCFRVEIPAATEEELSEHGYNLHLP